MKEDEELIELNLISKDEAQVSFLFFFLLLFHLFYYDTGLG